MKSSTVHQDAANQGRTRPNPGGNVNVIIDMTSHAHHSRLAGLLIAARRFWRACRAWRAAGAQARRPAAHGASRRRSQAAAPQLAAAADLPRRHQLRPRRRHRHRRQGNPVTDLKQTDFEVLEDGKPQTIESSGWSRSTADDAAGGDAAPQPIRTRDDEETAAARRDARIFVFFLDDYHVRARQQHVGRRSRSIDFIANQLAPDDLRRRDVSADAGRRRRPDAQSPGASSTRVEKFEGRKFDYEPTNDVRGGLRLLSDAEIVEQIRNQVSLAALEASRIKLGVAARRPQVGDPGQRGLHGDAAAADAQRPMRRRCRHSTDPARIRSPATNNIERGSRAVLQRRSTCMREMQDVFDAGQPQQHGDLCRRSARAGRGEFDINDEHRSMTHQPELSERRRWTRCASWPTTPTAAPSSIATISPRA